MSDEGIVALEFSSMHTAMEDALRIRFPEAELERSQEELAAVMETVADLIDDPTKDCGLPLDLRGTPYEVQSGICCARFPPGRPPATGLLRPSPAPAIPAM